MAMDYKIRKPFDRVTREDLIEDVKLAGSLHMKGDVIPSRWWQIPEFQYENGKPNPVAIMILAHLVYWYRPSESTDDMTGKRFAKPKITESNMLRKSYDNLANQFGFTKRQIQDACYFLRDRGVLEIHLVPKVKYKNGHFDYNVTYFRLNMPLIAEFTNHVEDEPQKYLRSELEFESPSKAQSPAIYTGENSETLNSEIQKFKDEVGATYFKAITRDRPARLTEWADKNIIGFWRSEGYNTREYNPIVFAREVDAAIQSLLENGTHTTPSVVQSKPFSPEPAKRQEAPEVAKAKESRKALNEYEPEGLEYIQEALGTNYRPWLGWCKSQSIDLNRYTSLESKYLYWVARLDKERYDNVFEFFGDVIKHLDRARLNHMEDNKKIVGRDTMYMPRYAILNATDWFGKTFDEVQSGAIPLAADAAGEVLSQAWWKLELDVYDNGYITPYDQGRLVEVINKNETPDGQEKRHYHSPERFALVHPDNIPWQGH
jgi:hypothetical protein